MKKFFKRAVSLAAAVSVFALSALSASAKYPNDRLKVRVPHASTAPNLDDGGKKDACYSNAEKLKFATFLGAGKGEFARHEAYTVWNGNAVYIWAKVYDSTKCDDNYGANNYVGESFHTDCLEIYVDYTFELSGSVRDSNKLTAQLRVNPDYDDTLPRSGAGQDQALIQYYKKLGAPYFSAKTDAKSSLPAMSDVLGIKQEKSRAVVTRDSDGYIVELKLNHGGWASKNIGLAMQIQDHNVKNGKDMDEEKYALRPGFDYFNTANLEHFVLEGYTPSAEYENWVKESAAAASSKAALTSSRNVSSGKPASSAAGGASASVPGSTSSIPSSITPEMSEFVESNKNAASASKAGNTSSKATESKGEAKDASAPAENSGLPVWAIVLIVVGGVIVVGGIAAAAIVLTKKKGAAPKDDE